MEKPSHDHCGPEIQTNPRRDHLVAIRGGPVEKGHGEHGLACVSVIRTNVVKERVDEGAMLREAMSLTTTAFITLQENSPLGTSRAETSFRGMISIII